MTQSVAAAGGVTAGAAVTVANLNSESPSGLISTDSVSVRLGPSDSGRRPAAAARGSDGAAGTAAGADGTSHVCDRRPWRAIL